ncbi:uncharacterized protein LOC141898925 [Tubulanus polymorphus]|uniref:uncharacterized protein LOC141898925 n=1 Tax=Tubulanus polymorphus TaxID=672921 RepID=UPI003DA5AB6B
MSQEVIGQSWPLVTRAIHLELAESLETDSFLLVLCNFIGRRGRPDEMFSNNGSNFIGAEKELKECLINWNQSRLSEFLSEKGTRWHFNPPSSPHFGGAWERLVRTVKVALKSVLRGRSFFENVLRTTLIEVEAVVNSRPLTYISSKPQDYTPLTPNHFLHGGATSITPQGVFHEREISSRKRWRQSQVLADHVWQRWLSEYLPSLTVRGKWFTENRNVRKGDLVLLVEKDVPRGYWPLGRIVDVYSGADSRVRTVKTATSEYIRPVAKICVLEENIE